MTKLNPGLIKILSKDNNLRPEAEQILERLSISKDTVPSSGQKESLQLCCKLLDSAVGFDDAIAQTLDAKGKPDAEYVPQLAPASGNQAVDTALAPRKASTPTTRSFPGLVEQSVARIEHAPLDGEASELWGKVADIGASVDAETLATSPFDGIKKASERIRAEANALEQHGEQIYFEKFGKAFNDPALLKKVAEQNLGKFPPEWDLNSKIQL